MTIILDSSAILSLVLAEPGAEIVAGELHRAITSTVMVAEVYGYAARNGLPLDAFDDFFDLPQIEVVPLGRAEAVVAGILIVQTRAAGLSLGDRCCLALAKSRGCGVLTGDRNWATCADELDIPVRLIR